MHRVWCHHGNHVKSTGGEHGLVIVKPLQVRILVELVFQRLSIRVADGNEIGSLIRVKHRDVPFADAPTAYDGKLNVFLIHYWIGMFFLCCCMYQRFTTQFPNTNMSMLVRW